MLFLSWLNRHTKLKFIHLAPWSVRPKFLSKDGVDEWTALLGVIVENYPNLRTTIVNNRKVCVDNNQKTRAH